MAQNRPQTSLDICGSFIYFIHSFTFSLQQMLKGIAVIANLFVKFAIFYSKPSNKHL